MGSNSSCIWCTGLHIRVFHWNGSSPLGYHVRGNSVHMLYFSRRSRSQVVFHQLRSLRLFGMSLSLSSSCIICKFLVKILQIFPIHVKSAAGSLVVLVNWLGAWAVSYTFGFLMAWTSTGEFLHTMHKRKF